MQAAGFRLLSARCTTLSPPGRSSFSFPPQSSPDLSPWADTRGWTRFQAQAHAAPCGLYALLRAPEHPMSAKGAAPGLSLPSKGRCKSLFANQHVPLMGAPFPWVGAQGALRRASTPASLCGHPKQSPLPRKAVLCALPREAQHGPRPCFRPHSYWLQRGEEAVRSKAGSRPLCTSCDRTGMGGGPSGPPGPPSLPRTHWTSGRPLWSLAHLTPILQSITQGESKAASRSSIWL